ncbi:flagellar protein FliT [Cytobacillus dafuensis]|uniref:Flagellar protein FliT n=1 Tax=Cytobacillus dafuensis TaxID=1742359 RepID=A0A5B8Z9J4_CYTDA|nr:flagellar protein FliT [Cytobacillus dafuensis]QED49591.1 flagellar protein FliT [Cytobacillus dafuensis]
MSAVQEYFDLTKQLYMILQGQVGADEREDIIHQVEALLEKRGPLLVQLTPPYSLDEQELGKQIIQWEQEINRLMKNLKSQIQTDLQELKKKKNHVQSYSNPYEAVNGLDGVYYDKKN